MAESDFRVKKGLQVEGGNLAVEAGNITASGSLTGTSITLSSGSSSNFLLGDGSTVATSTYLTTSSASSTYQPLDSTLTGLAALGTSAGIVVDDGDQTFSIITNNSANWNTAYNNMIASASFNTGTGVITLTQQDSGTVTVDIDGRFQESSTELTNLLSTTGTTAGFVKDDGDGTFTIDTSTYLTGNQTVTLSGDVTGSGTTAITTTIAANAVGTDELNVTGTGTTSQFLRSDGDGSFTWATPTDTNTEYTAGTGLALSSTTFSVDLSGLTDMTATMVGTDEFIVLDAGADRRKAASEIGLSIFSNDSGFTTNTGTITGVTAGTGLSGGGTSGTVTLNVSGLTTSEIAAGSLLIAGETFVDNDTSLMTAAAINDRIESFGYTSNTGDITGVTAGTGLSGGGTSGSVTLNVSGLTTSEIAAGSLLIAGETFADNDTSLMTAAAINDRIESFNYSTTTGTVTSVGVTAGTGLSGGGTVTSSGTVSLDVDLSELTTSITDGDGDFFVVVDSANAQKKLTKGNIAISGFNNDSNFITSSVSSLTSLTTIGPAIGTVSIQDNLTVGGNLTISGTTTTIDTTNLYVEDTSITLNRGGSTATSGIDIEGTSAATVAAIRWNSSSSRWEFSNDGSSYQNIPIASEYGTGTITGVTAGTGLSGGGTSGTVTLNVSGLTTSEIAAGSLLISGEAFVDTNTQLMTAAAINDRIESFGYTSNTGDITGVTAGTGLSGGGTSGGVTVNFDGNSLSASGTLVGTDDLVVVDGTTSAKTQISTIPLSIFNNDSGFTTNVGDITGVTAGTGLSGGGTSGTVSLNVDLSQLTTSITDGDGDFFVVVDSANAQKKLTKGNIAISGFNNDSGFTTNTGTVTSVGVTAGTGLSGGGTITTSGTVTLNVSGLTTSEIAAGSLLIAGETFADNDTSLMTAAAINDRIESFGYTSNTGTVTSVGTGTGLTGGAITTSGTLSLDLGAVIASDAENRVLTSDGDGTLTAESNMLFNTTPNGNSGNEIGHLDVDLGSAGNYEPVIRAENTATSAHFLSSPLFAKTKINGAHALIAENNSTGTQGMVVTRAGRLGVRVDPDVSDPTGGYELFVSGDVKARSLTLYGSSPATISVGRWETTTKGSGTSSTNLVVRDTGYDPDTTTYMGLPSSGFVSINGGTGISYTISASTDTITLGSAASWSDGQTVVEVLGTNTSYPDRALKVVSGYAGSHSTTDAVRLFDLDGVGTTFVNTISSGSLTGDGSFNILSLDTTSFKAAEAIIHVSDGTNAYSSKIFFDSSGNFGEYQVLKDASSIVIDIDVGVTGGSATIKADYTGASTTTLTAKVRVEGVV